MSKKFSFNSGSEPQGSSDPRTFLTALRAALEELERSPLARSLDRTGDYDAFSRLLLDECWLALTRNGIDGVTVVRAMLGCAGAVYEFCNDHHQNWEIPL